MNRLRVAPGDGRLLRRGRFIIFSLEADEELQQLRPSPGGEIFKALASLIVARNFAVSSLAAIDLEDCRLFVFGDVEIDVDGERVSGADSATWTERRFTPGATVTSVGMHASLQDTELVEGCVPASAFDLNLVVPKQAARADDAPFVRRRSAPRDAAIDLTESVPLRPSAGVAASNGIPTPPMFESDDTEQPESGDLGVQKAIVNRRARLVCSNGYSVLVGRGLIVGRFPSKHGVPEGYGTLKVTGAQVSRVHLRFTLDDGVLNVRDENTANGSTLISSERAIRPVPSGSRQVALEVGDAIEFGDQTIVFHEWESVGHVTR